MKTNNLLSVQKKLVYLVACLSMLAGLIHVWVIPEHFEEWIGYGIFFVLIALFQFLFVYLILRYSFRYRSILWLGIFVNAGIIILWLYTRMFGVPFGSMAGEVEAIGMLDTMSKFFEIVLIGCLISLLREKKH